VWENPEPSSQECGRVMPKEWLQVRFLQGSTESIGGGHAAKEQKQV